MIYDQLKIILNKYYADFTDDVIKRQVLSADNKYSLREQFFAKAIFKTLLRQKGDEDLDILTKKEIQDIIKLFNRVSNSACQLEYFKNE